MDHVTGDNRRKNIDIQDFPALADRIDWGVVRAEFVLSDKIDESKVSNVSIIPHVGDKYVIFQVASGMWELPGGTLEQGERYLNALKREVMEELGGELVSYHIFGQFDCESSADQPYRPYIPHPKFVRIIGHGEVRLVGQPLNPEDGEQVIAVELVDIDEAVRRLRSVNRHDIADMYRLADTYRRSGIST
ncbi:NUDIX hydrolase [Paenibacillaceae bacterium]|nr:NUDIX hydrolase [Paenibacillaceae bacterium]